MPEIKHATDTSNFDPVDVARLQQKDQSVRSPDFPNHALVDFTFHRFFDESGHPVIQYCDTVPEESLTFDGDEHCNRQLQDHIDDDDADVGVYV